MRTLIAIVAIVLVLGTALVAFWKYYDARSSGLQDGTGRQTEDEAAGRSSADAPEDSALVAPGGAAVDTSDSHAILSLQVELIRAGFSPGIVDGKLGKNTQGAIHWFQKSQGLPTTGFPDAETAHRLDRDQRIEPLRQYAVADSDLTGPFTNIPDDVYEKAKLECLCYESPLEGIAERFHTSPELLRALNPGLPASPAAGSIIVLPNVPPMGSPRPAETPVTRLLVSKRGFYTLALDEQGTIVNFFPSTLGSKFDPSPSETVRVRKATRNPWFHYQPRLFSEVPDDKPEANLPPGPNSPVGVVWIDLSKEHFGIHGTAEPETIGYTTSHGCVRLTNWDASFLAGRLVEGAVVEFQE